MPRFLQSMAVAGNVKAMGSGMYTVSTLIPIQRAATKRAIP